MSVFKMPLNEQRQFKVKEICSSIGNFNNLVDFGCGSGSMLALIINFALAKRIIAIDQHEYFLNELIELLDVSERDRAYLRSRPLTLEVYCGNILKFDARLTKIDVLMSIEVIEHLQIKDVPQYSKMIFETYKPKYVIISTPNRDFNTLMGWNRFRNTDHKFEWTKSEFEAWCEQMCSHGYSYEWFGCGSSLDCTEEFKKESETEIYATQFAKFTKNENAPKSQTDLDMPLSLIKQIVYPHE